jgi:putative transposase
MANREDRCSTKTHQAFRYALDPTRAQCRALASHCGAARFAFNWGLQLVTERSEARRKDGVTDVPWTLASLRWAWNRAKADVAPWWRENSKEAYSSGLDGLARALQNFTAVRRGARRGRSGFPQFRRRGRKESCRFTTGVMRTDGDRHVVLGRVGRLRTAEVMSALRRRIAAGTARIMSVSVTKEADRWFVSFTCEVVRMSPSGNSHADTVGVDVGVLRLATVSTGAVMPGEHALASSMSRLRTLQRLVARRQSGSQRRRRAVFRLARAHRRVRNVRRDYLHKVTTHLAKSHGRVVIEDLNVLGMMASSGKSAAQPGQYVRAKAALSRGLGDAALGQLRRMLTYKCDWYGSRLLVVPRFFASSRRCSGCGRSREALSLDERVFVCTGCGLKIDRDLNAARNLVWWADANDQVAASAVETQNARGEDVSPSLGWAGLGEARTEIGSEPAGTTGGPQDGAIRPLLRNGG